MVRNRFKSKTTRIEEYILAVSDFYIARDIKVVPIHIRWKRAIKDVSKLSLLID